MHRHILNAAGFKLNSYSPHSALLLSTEYLQYNCVSNTITRSVIFIDIFQNHEYFKESTFVGSRPNDIQRPSGVTIIDFSGKVFSVKYFV